MRVAEVVRAARQLRFFESLDVDEERNDLGKDKNRLEHVTHCIWTGLLHDASGFYEFMEEVVTAKSVRLK